MGGRFFMAWEICARQLQRCAAGVRTLRCCVCWQFQDVCWSVRFPVVQGDH